MSGMNTLIGMAITTVIGSYTVGLILPKSSDNIEAAVHQIESNRYTRQDADLDLARQIILRRAMEEDIAANGEGIKSNRELLIDLANQVGEIKTMLSRGVSEP